MNATNAHAGQEEAISPFRFLHVQQEEVVEGLVAGCSSGALEPDVHEVGHRTLLHLLVVVHVLQVRRMIASVLHHLFHLVELVVKVVTKVHLLFV